MNFTKFKDAVAKQFKAMSTHDLFRTNVTKDELWQTYLSSFPDGSNPIYRERTEHDCNCCKQFIRAVGNVVAIVDGKLISIWDIIVDEPAYQTVASALSELVKSKSIDNIFLHTERTAGTDKNFEQAIDGVKTWEHFFVNIPSPRVVSKQQIGPRLSDARALRDVLIRSLNEITDDSVDTVLELIAQNSLYRGEEHRHAVASFKTMKQQFGTLREDDRDPFVWSKIAAIPASVAKIRNTAIGTLLTNLSEGKDLEYSVKAFEALVAPANYKRPTALVTKAMVDKAKVTLQDLGLTSALERRYATLQDIAVPNTLFADRSARKAMGDVFDEIASTAKAKVPNLDRVEEVHIEKFLSDVLPKTDAIEVLVENRLTSNLVSLIAPVDPTAGHLLKWNNLFSWSYSGDFADSIKERVKKAGGNVTGDLCCRLAWFNNDDLDFHMVEPSGYEIQFGNRRRLSPNGGTLDVDMNGGDGMDKGRRPVENIFYHKLSTMRPGTYKLFVHQWSRRESIDIGFEAEIDLMGAVHHFSYDRMVSGSVVVAEILVAKDGTATIDPKLPSTTASKTIWNLPTQQFHKVNIAMLSPNYWDGNAVGNKHYFFMLDGCRNDGTARGFFNEFLDSSLDQHRKVFEIVGSKMRTDNQEAQLSGLGFSSTQRNHVIVRVKGAFTRDLKVTF